MWEKFLKFFTPLKQMWLFLIAGLIIQVDGFHVSYESLLVVAIGATISLVGLSYALRKACLFAFIDILIYGLAALIIACGLFLTWNFIIVAIPSLMVSFLSFYISCSALLEGKPITETFNVKEQLLYQLNRVQLYNLAKQRMAEVSIKWRKSRIVKVLSQRLNMKEVEIYAAKPRRRLQEKGRGSKLSITLGGTLLSLSLANVLPSAMALLGASMLVQGYLAHKGKIKSI